MGIFSLFRWTRPSSLFLLVLAIALVGCGMQPQKQSGKDDQSAEYTKLQNANYVVSQMSALNSRVQSSSKASATAKSAAASALAYAKSLEQQVQSDYAAESNKSETDPASNSASSNADDARSQALAQQVNSAAHSAISYATGVGIKTSDVDPTTYLRVIYQP